PPLLIIDAGIDTVVCDNTIFMLGGNPTAMGGVPPYQFIWAELPLSNESNPIIITDSSKLYHLTVIDSNGCIITDSIFIDVVICQGINSIENLTSTQLIPNPNEGTFII